MTVATHDANFWDDRPYYDDRATAYDLEPYFERLVQYIGPTPLQAAYPEHRSSRIQAKRQGVRDDELAALRVDDMTPLARSIFWSELVRTGRAAMAIERFPNLAALSTSDVIDRKPPLTMIDGRVGRSDTHEFWHSFAGRFWLRSHGYDVEKSLQDVNASGLTFFPVQHSKASS